MLWSGSAFHFPLDKKQFKNHLKLTKVQYPGYFYYLAFAPGQSEPLGHIELSRINRNRSAFISRVYVSTRHRGRGIGTEMLKALLLIAFREFRLHRVESSVYTFNKNAIRLYEHAGFMREGLLRDVLFTGKEYWSEYRYSMLATEWRT